MIRSYDDGNSCHLRGTFSQGIYTGVSRYYLDIVDISVDIVDIITPSCSSADSWPSSRAKHAGCVHAATGQVYILAGRCGTNL